MVYTSCVICIFMNLFIPRPSGGELSSLENFMLAEYAFVAFYISLCVYSGLRSTVYRV